MAMENKPLAEANQNCVRLLQTLDIDIDKLEFIDKPTQFDKIIIPDESFYFGADSDIYFTEAYRETINIIKDFAIKNRKPVPNKKIYFYHGLRQIGEERIAEYFKSKGYEIITPEQRATSFEETLNLLINCESFVSTVGSCSHDSIFLREGTEAIIIKRSMDRFNTYQWVVNEANRLNVIWIDTSMNVYTGGLFCYVISEQLKRFFGDKWNGYTEDDYKNFLEYAKDALLKGCTVNQELIGYAVFKDFYASLLKQRNLIRVADMPPEWENFRPRINYSICLSGKFTPWIRENEISAPLEDKSEIQAIMIIPPRPAPFHKIYLSVYYNDKEGWTEEAVVFKVPGTAGTRGKPIYGVKIRLDEAGAKEFDILYRVHKFDDEWTPWAKNGEALYSHGQKLNAIQIKLEIVNKIDKVVTDDRLWTENDEALYLGSQRQDITQTK